MDFCFYPEEVVRRCRTRNRSNILRLVTKTERVGRTAVGGQTYGFLCDRRRDGRRIVAGSRCLDGLGRPFDGFWDAALTGVQCQTDAGYIYGANVSCISGAHPVMNAQPSRKACPARRREQTL